MMSGNFETVVEDAMCAIHERMEDGCWGNAEAAFQDLFNDGNYMLYDVDADSLLEGVGYLNAIKKIVEYENESFGRVLTKFESPIEVANMLYYIIGEEVMCDLKDRGIIKE